MCCLQLVVLSGNSEIRLYNSRVAKIFSRFCNCRHSRSSISSHNCEGLEHRIESQEVPVEGGTSLETIGLKDLPKVLSSLWRYFCKCRVSAMVLNTLVTAPFVFSYVLLLWDKTTSHLMFLRLKVMKCAF